MLDVALVSHPASKVGHSTYLQRQNDSFMKKSPTLNASSLQQRILETIARQVTSTVQEVERTKLILAMLVGKSNQQVNDDLGYS